MVCTENMFPLELYREQVWTPGLDTQTYMFLQSTIFLLLQGFKQIFAWDLHYFVFGLDASFETQTAHESLNLGGFEIWLILLPPILETLTTAILTDFSVLQKNAWKT